MDIMVAMVTMVVMEAMGTIMVTRDILDWAITVLLTMEAMVAVTMEAMAVAIMVTMAVVTREAMDIKMEGITTRHHHLNLNMSQPLAHQVHLLLSLTVRLQHLSHTPHRSHLQTDMVDHQPLNRNHL